jgi:uncharacterized delta-60 repeat protein
MRRTASRPASSGARFIVLAIACMASGPPAHAAAGDLDPSFGKAGQVMTGFGRSTDLANAVAVQADGKLVVVGTTYTDNDFSNEDFAIARYLPDGRLDQGFGVDGRVTTDFPGLAAVAAAVALQPDGKIVVAGGAFPLFAFGGDFKLARYNPDGTLDAGFGEGGIVTTRFVGGSFAAAVALQGDGRIVAAGTDYTGFSFDDSSDTDFALARYLPDGSPDTSFGIDGQLSTDFAGFDDDALSVLVQPDGRIVAVGSGKDAVDDFDFAVARYLKNGKLDTSFGTGGRVRTDFGDHGFDRARSAALQADGRIVAAGFAISQDGIAWNFALARYDAAGHLDPSFSGDGLRQVSFGSCCQSAEAVRVQQDGRIVVAGYPDSESSDSDFTLARLNRNGTLDNSFGTGGRVRTSFGNLNGGARGAALQADGRIVAVGFQATATKKEVQFALARYFAE